MNNISANYSKFDLTDQKKIRELSKDYELFFFNTSRIERLYNNYYGLRCDNADNQCQEPAEETDYDDVKQLKIVNYKTLKIFVEVADFFASSVKTDYRPDRDDFDPVACIIYRIIKN